MTYGALKDAVRHLGLVDSFDDRTLESCMPDATQRGLRTLARLLPRTAVYRLAHYPPSPVYVLPSLAYDGNTVEISCAGVSAVCFYVAGGAGSVTIETEGFSITRDFAAPLGARVLTQYYISELFPEITEKLFDLTLSFTGDGFYLVEALTFYGLLGIADVFPNGDHIFYDISSLVTDFLRLQTPPVRRGNELLTLNTDYSLVDAHTVSLSPALSGTFDIYYERRPRDVTLDTQDEEALDVAVEVEDLLPLIVAYYVWAEDEPEKASEYYQRYAEQAALVQSRRRVQSNLKFKSFDGWD